MWGSILHPSQGMLLPPPSGLRGALYPQPWLWRAAYLGSILPWGWGGPVAAPPPLPAIPRGVTSAACE